MKIVKRLLIILLLTAPLAMTANYLFKVLDAKDGLTSSQVNCILKDSRGFIWMGTPAGLYRYDGYSFRHFQTDSQDGQSLPDSYIYSVQEENNGTLCIKTATGYCIYNPQSETFERDIKHWLENMKVNTEPEIIFIDSKHNVWAYVPRRGILHYNTQQQLGMEFPMSGLSNNLPNGVICSIGECKDGAIAVYNDGRLVCMEPRLQATIAWTNDYVATNKLRKSNSLKVFADQKDDIWLYGHGTLFVLNKKNGTWDTTMGNQLGLTGVTADNSVNSMSGDRKGNIWLATSRHGVQKINVDTHVMEPVDMKTMSNLEMRLTTGNNMTNIQCVYIDNSDLLWVGTSKSGVAYWGEDIYRFTSKHIGDVTAMVQDSTDNVLYGTSDNGIVGYEGPLASLCVTALARTSDGSLWVGSQQNGLTRILNGTTTFYSTTSADHKIVNNHINAMCTDKNGILWIATEGGLQNYNPRLNTFASFNESRNGLPSNNITALYKGMDNELFIGTSEGLSIMDLSTGKQEHLIGDTTGSKRFTNTYITQVFQDSRKLLWVGTREGLNVLNKVSNELYYITERQDIPICNNNICGIAEDKNGNILVTTSNGVCRIVVDYHQGVMNYGLYNYSQSDGLQANEFNNGSILTKTDGNIEMGGIYGVSQMRDKSDSEKTALPKVILSQLFIGDEEIQTGKFYNDRIILESALNETKKIDLEYRQNTFTIKFAAGNYNQSERLQFNYMLEGYSDQWVNGDAKSHGVTFNNLKSGTYILHVKASSAENNAQPSQETTLIITIAPAWWWSNWMKACYLIFAIIVFYLWKRGIDQLRSIWNRKKAVITELVRQREEIKLASDDLRQPMARMTSIIMNLAEKETTLEEREQLNNLHSQMLQIITQVSDMQAALEHPEETARQNVRNHYELDSDGQMKLPDTVGEELTYEIRHRKEDSPLSGFKVFFIDDNEEISKFVESRLSLVYSLRTFSSTQGIMAEIESTLPDLVICKQDMPGLTGSELCKKLKMDNRLYKIKFILTTESKMTQKEMKEQGISMSADDFLAKPFNLQEAVMRINKQLGIDAFKMNSNLIEGAETRMLEGFNSSMTTSTVNMGYGDVSKELVEDQEIKLVTVRPVKEDEEPDDMGAANDDRSMSDMMDRQLIDSIEEYVRHNMSRGTINLEEMATAMGMAMKPFFQKVRDITGKTPADVVRDMRLKHACILLQRTNINMNELASNVGFTTADHFISTFKERFSISPTEYRLKYRR
ncbi:MAG: helix-turn-helix domain-containing protein [Prevotella sp.]|nr:helix-turn-helix domain-containing protein [Prevotella sp.]